MSLKGPEVYNGIYGNKAFRVSSENGCLLGVLTLGTGVYWAGNGAVPMDTANYVQACK